MSVYKPKNSSIFQFDFRWRGNRFYGSTGQKTRRAAERVEGIERANAALGIAKLRVITLDQAAGLYEDGLRANNRWDGDTERWLGALVNAVGSDKFLHEITFGDLAKHYRARAAVVSGSSVNREIDVAKALWAMMQREEYHIGKMPAFAEMRYAVADFDPRELSHDEEDRLLPALRADLRPFFEFLLRSGWRVSEARNLTWREVDFPAGKARVRLKGGKVAARTLGAEMIALIASQPQVKDCPYVFTYICQQLRKDRHGKRFPFSKNGWRKEWTKALKAAGIEKFRPHDLRHTRGTRIVRTTGNLVLAKDALGHTNIRTTMRYVHASDADVRWALDVSDSRDSPEVRTQGNKNARKSA